MKSPFPYSDSNKRYYTYDYFLRKKFGQKVFKVTLDAGFTCPNIDGSKGRGGCTYCSSRGSGDFAASASLSIEEQYNTVRAVMDKKWEGGLCIPYFQAHTNTYAPTCVLREKFEQTLKLPDAVGLDIATRADCLSDETVEYLRELHERTFLTVELGLQTVHDVTAEKINRCHTYEEFLKGYEKLKGLNVCVHIINGLPGETHEMMLDTARELARIRPFMLKIHLLHIIAGTKMAEQYLAHEFELPTLEEYVEMVCDQLEILPEDTVIARVTGDGAPDTLVAPLWSKKKFVVMNEIDKELLRRNSMQGSKYFQKT